MRDDYAVDRIADATTYDSEGAKVGTAGRVFTDSEGGDPTFVAVNTGLFGMSETIVPLAGARMKGDELHLEYTTRPARRWRRRPTSSPPCAGGRPRWTAFDIPGGRRIHAREPVGNEIAMWAPAGPPAG